jgi:CHAD domain-containing protein
VAKGAETVRNGKPLFHIRKREPPGSGISRAINEQLQAACRELTRGGSAIDEAVHEARKALKKSRALLRLARPALNGDYREWNIELRDIGRQLSELRDAGALLETVGRLRQQPHDSAVDRLLDETHGGLLERKRKIVIEFERSDELAVAAKKVEAVAERIAANAVTRATALTISAGVAETVRRGGKAFAVARRTQQAVDFHECRKRAKDLRYQISFLDRLWPPVLEGYAESARDLEQSLGEDHNVFLLRGMLATRNSSRQHLRLLDAILDREQRRLRKQAETIGDLLYADEPKHWEKRISRCLNNR